MPYPAQQSDDGTYYCDECYKEKFTRCDNCHEEITIDDAIASTAGNYYCEACYNDKFTHCQHCDTELRSNDVCTSNDGDEYCSACYADLFITCDQCGCELSEDDVYGCDEGHFCESCFDHHRQPPDEFDYAHFEPSAPTYTQIRSERKFGVELETSKCPCSDDVRDDTIFGCKEDGSIAGMEFVSPPLYADQGLAAIRKFCQVASRNNFEVNADCGFHAHFDVTGLSVLELRSIAYAYHRTYAVWSAFVSGPRRRNDFCKPNTWGRESLANIRTQVAWDQFTNQLDRYRWCNLAAYYRHKTIEIRLHTATLVADKICNWVMAHARFIDAVKDMTFAQIDRRFGGSVSDSFAEVAKTWDDTELTDFYASRAERFGTEVRATV